MLRHPDHMTRLMETVSLAWRKGSSDAFASILKFFNMPLDQERGLEQSDIILPGGDSLKLFTANFLVIIQHHECGRALPKKTMIFSVDWIERLTRCLSGTLLSYFCVDLPFFCLKTNLRDTFPSTVLNFEGEADWVSVKGEKKTYQDWRNSMQPLLNHLGTILSMAADQRTCEDSKSCLNRAAGSMKKFWVALMAKQQENGETAINSLSEQDYLDLKSEAVKEGGSFLMKWITILEAIEEEWELQPFDMLNLARSYVLFPIGSYSSDDFEQAFDAVDGKIEGEASVNERLEYLKCAISLQKRLKAAYLGTGREARSPSVYCSDTESWVPRNHWAEGTEEFALLNDAEKKEAFAADFSTREAPLDFFSIMSLEADDHGAVDVTTRRTEPSLKESLRSAPMMYGVTPEDSYKAAFAEEQGLLIAGQKPEGGKQAAEKITVICHSFVSPKNRIQAIGPKCQNTDESGREFISWSVHIKTGRANQGPYENFARKLSVGIFDGH